MVASPHSFMLVNNMADGKKKRADSTIYTLSEAVNALIATLQEADYPIDYSSLTLKYHIDIGILVKLVSGEIPDFPIGTNWLMEGSGYEWLVNSIDEFEDKYVVAFLLEEEI